MRIAHSSTGASTIITGTYVPLALPMKACRDIAACRARCKLAGELFRGGDATALPAAAAAGQIAAAAGNADEAIAVSGLEAEAWPKPEAEAAGVAGDDDKRTSRPPRDRLCDPPDERREGGGSDRKDSDDGRIA